LEWVKTWQKIKERYNQGFVIPVICGVKELEEIKRKNQ